MPVKPVIRYLQRNEIDTSKWDHCISNASNGLIYGYSKYLDAMAMDWHALVQNDYEAVMPLPWRKKWAVSYLYQPSLTAQLGVFGNNMTKEVLAAFLKAVPEKYRYWDFSLNHQNLFAVEGFPLYLRMNYVLPLNKPYTDLYKGYRENIRRNIKKSRDYGCSTVKEIGLDAIINLTKFQAKDVSQTDFDAFTKLFSQLQEKGMAKTYGIVSKTGDLLSSAAFLFSHKRAYYILVGNHPNGRTLGASHALIDAFIRDHADQDLLLDFEGSDIRNLAFFYSSFGASEEKYAAIRHNRLPWWIKWIK
jgi:hypothetical protein